MYNHSMDTITAPLTYDPAIYWLEPHYRSAHLRESCDQLDTHYDAYAHAHLDLCRHSAAGAKDAGWIAYMTIEGKRSEDDALILYQDCYEQPGFTKIHRYAGPPHMTRLYIQPQHGDPIALGLRRLMYHGKMERGALHGTELYIVYADIKPEARGGITDA